jgi:addiction module HigA family antidote
VLPGLGVTVTEAARDLGVSRQTLHAILAERAPVTPAMAVRLGRWCGIDPRPWLAMQSERDLWEAAHALASEVAAIPRRRRTSR